MIGRVETTRPLTSVADILALKPGTGTQPELQRLQVVNKGKMNA